MMLESTKATLPDPQPSPSTILACPSIGVGRAQGRVSTYAIQNIRTEFVRPSQKSSAGRSISPVKSSPEPK